MANKNKNVIIAYYPGTDKANMAANQLKEWDKANADIKLGGVGILAWDQGKIVTRNVGARATGTGAKAGIALGVVLGILSGGVTVIGGAIAGILGGSILGSLKHKGLGISDADKQKMEAELKAGKAALVVMADENEVGPTKAQLEYLGGQVVSFAVPAEAAEAVDKAAEAAAAAPEAAAPAPDAAAPAASTPEAPKN